MAEVEDKRIRRTKKLLRQALTRLMQQKDFQSITVTDVVREADINRGTFYAYPLWASRCGGPTAWF